MFGAPSRVSANSRAASRSTDSGIASGCCFSTAKLKSPAAWDAVFPDVTR
ncbi:MAG: hypothetical protein ACLPQY_10560 [Streptosporangiaceae bacterium]